MGGRYTTVSQRKVGGDAGQQKRQQDLQVGEALSAILAARVQPIPQENGPAAYHHPLQAALHRSAESLISN